MADDNWDNDQFENDFSKINMIDKPKGRSFGAGRGYQPFDDQYEDQGNDGGDYQSHGYDDNNRGYGGRGSGYRGRGRGGRGRGGHSDRGGRGGFSRDDNHASRDDGNSEKPREHYIPPELPDNESELFGSEIGSGNNFENFYNSNVEVTGKNSSEPIESFENSGLHPFILANVKKSGYLKPTPIQKNAIPVVMAGRDLMGCAQTGSGKTAAFLLPILHYLLENQSELNISRDKAEPEVIILSPTRELALQITKEATKFAHGSIIRICIAYGGTAVQHQANLLKRGCHILVATVGRLKDFLDKRIISFNSVKFIVLDEADRMLDMGFKSSVEEIMQHETMSPKDQRQTLMFSATFPRDIQELAATYLEDYIFIAIGIVGGACSDVEQNFYKLEKFEKKNKLKEIIESTGKTEHTLIFVETKRNTDYIAAFIAEFFSFPSTSIHGDRLQRERETALEDFKSGRCRILVATDVAARGLDIKGVTHVINYDLPSKLDEYVHRIGRTGRVGNRGRATSFYDPSRDAQLASGLLKILKETDQEIPDFLNESNYNADNYNSNSEWSDIRGDSNNFDNNATNAEEECW